MNTGEILFDACSELVISIMDFDLFLAVFSFGGDANH